MGNTSTHKRHSSGEDGTPVFSTSSTGQNKFVYPQLSTQLSTSLDDSSASVEFMQGSFKESGTLEANMLSAVIQNKVIPTVFKWKGSAHEVYISGSFNGWKNKLPMVKSQGDFYTIIDLPEGSHQYKFYVDGAWSHDPSEKTTSNNLGSLNNVVAVKKSDFEVFEALAQDSFDTSTTASKKGSYSSKSPPGDYSQEIPSRKPERHINPPVLPPHLLQVILNKEIPVHCEPNLLPEPNHVMLNHLYALSIKDGVMVLSATHRYRKKYVTTLLYKPI